MCGLTFAAAVTVPGQGEDGGEQAGEGVAGAAGAASAVPAAGAGGDVAADEREDGGEGDEAGIGPARAAARAAAVAVMLWMSSSAQASCRASSGDWPRRARRGPRTVFFRWRNAISICHLSAYRAAISRAGYVS